MKRNAVPIRTRSRLFRIGLSLALILPLLIIARQSAAQQSTPPTPDKTQAVGRADTIDFYTLTLPPDQVPPAPTGQSIPARPVSPLGQQLGGEVEPNGAPATASPIASGTTIHANLFPNGDVDYYAFTAQAGDRAYAAIMTSFSAGSSTDSQLTVLASDGTTVIEFDDDNGTFAGLSSSIAGAMIPTTGTYYLKVNDFTAGTTSERGYELHFRLQRGAPTAEVEGNDMPAMANPLAAGGWMAGARNPAAATEQDWYSFSANAGDTIFLSLDLDPERDGVTWNGRLGIALFGDAGNQILVADDAGTGDVSPNPNRPSEALFVTVKNAGTYYAFVDSATATTGGPTATYNLSVDVLPAFDEGVNCTTYTSTDVPKTIGPGTGLVSSNITIPGNPRIADIDVSIVLTHALMIDIDAHLRSPAGNDNGLFTDIGAAATGGQTQMDTTFDDEAGGPPSFTVFKGLILKPENNSTAGTANASGAYRLAWFDGEDAGGTWTLDLRDDTANVSGGTLTSWSLRVCEPPPAPTCPIGYAATTVFSTDFESGAAGFTHSGAQDEWALGLPATAATTTANPVAGFSTCNSGSSCWKTDLTGTYNASSNQDLLSPNISLAGLSAPVVVSWAQRHQIEAANYDHMFVDFQQVGGATPVRLYEWVDPTPISASAGTGNPQANIGGSAGWGLHTARADSLAGLNSELRFHLDSDTSVQFGGLAIDDVTVTACAPLPVYNVTQNQWFATIQSGINSANMDDVLSLSNAVYNENVSVDRSLTLSATVGAEINGTFTVNSGVTTTVSGTFTLSNTFTNNGTLRQTLDVPDGPATTRFLHFADAAGATDQYFGVDVTPNGTGLGTTTVVMRGNQAQCSTTDSLIHRCFDIAPASQQPATVRFWYLNSEKGNEDPLTMQAWHFNGSGFDLLTPAGTPRGTVGAYEWVEAVNVGVYSPFGLADGNPGAPSAVTLEQFAAQPAAPVPAGWVLLALPGLAALGVWFIVRRRLGVRR